MAKVLIVEDEADLRDLIGSTLREAGFTPLPAATGSEGLQRALQEQPDLILLDLMLPEMDGFEVCRALQREPATRGIPVILVSGRTSELDRVIGFELGADDYVTKPFSPRELVLRIRRSLERGREDKVAADRMVFDELAIDATGHRVTVDGREVGITATEFRLLLTLARRRGRVQSRDRLLEEVWSRDHGEVDARTVDTHVRRLREKLGKAARFIDTVRGVGYRFVTG